MPILLLPALLWLVLALFPRRIAGWVRASALAAALSVIVLAYAVHLSLLDCTDGQVALVYVFAPFLFGAASLAIFGAFAGVALLGQVLDRRLGPSKLPPPLLPTLFGLAACAGVLFVGLRYAASDELKTRASRSDVTSASLERVADAMLPDHDETTLMALAENRRASPELLRRLSRAPGELVRARVLRNSACPPEVVEALVHDPAWSVRAAVADSSLATGAQLQALTHDPEPYVAQRARGALTRCEAASLPPDGGR